MRLIQIKLISLSCLIIGHTCLSAEKLSHSNSGSIYPIASSYASGSYICMDEFENEKQNHSDELKRLNINNSKELREYLFKSNQLFDIVKTSPDFMTVKPNNAMFYMYFSSLGACQEFTNALKNKKSLQKWTNTTGTATTSDTNWQYESSQTDVYLMETKKIQDWLVQNFPNRYLKYDWGEKRILTKGNNECELKYEYFFKDLQLEESILPSIYDEDFTATINMSKINLIQGATRSYDGSNGIIVIRDKLTVDVKRIDDLGRELNALTEKYEKWEKMMEKEQEIRNTYADADMDEDKILKEIKKSFPGFYNYSTLDGPTIKKKIEDTQAEYDKAQEYDFIGIKINSKKNNIFDGNVTLLVPGSEENSVIFYVEVLRGYHKLCQEKIVSTSDQEALLNAMSKFRPFPKLTETIDISESDISEDDSLMGEIYAMIESKAQKKLQKELYKLYKNELDKKKQYELLRIINKLEYMNGKYKYYKGKLEKYEKKYNIAMGFYHTLASATKHMNDANAAGKEANQAIDPEVQLAEIEKYYESFIGKDGKDGLLQDLAKLSAMSADLLYNKIIRDLKLLKLK